MTKIKEDSPFWRALPVNIELYQHNKSPANLARVLQAYEPRETRKDIYIYTVRIGSFSEEITMAAAFHTIFSLDVIIIDLRYLFL